MVYFITFFVFGLVIFLMSLGVVFANKQLRGSCGGPKIIGPDGEPLSCATCPNRDKNPKCENKAKTAKTAAETA